MVVGLIVCCFGNGWRFMKLPCTCLVCHEASRKQLAGRAFRLHLPQDDDALEVAGLGEEVEGLHGGEFVSGGGEGAEVAHLGSGVARNVNHGAGAVGEELF